MGLAEGKAAFISGVVRGQGRSHAIRLAEEGADIIGFDICADDDAVEYPLATPADLSETRALIENLGRTASLEIADGREYDVVKSVAASGVARFVQEYPDVAAIMQNPFPLPNGLLEPEGVTNSILHLVSDAGQFITGTEFRVAAGFSSRA
ncbi:hypothetical protein [Mycolicibacterium sphagni]|uniref:SDR family mycofactocin-dependent oxidoreductase n=1 Tax=Mycolicibacterium sphagni TaxID=1786 RepID=A0A255DA05_9MYCO|nr:hypothetical protein [Mycolicibacterium sphagni]OYN76196.1 hypothetical protein CG716_22880 [Mycolicibacterium sphagni]